LLAQARSKVPEYLDGDNETIDGCVPWP
jgi:hypothetical protein